MKARIRVALRHVSRLASGGPGAVVRIGKVCIDLEGRRVTREGRDIRLTALEYRRLEILARHSGKVLTQRMLLTQMWGPEHVADTHYLRIYVKHLRDKIEPDPGLPQYLITETGVGVSADDQLRYCFVAWPHRHENVG